MRFGGLIAAIVFAAIAAVIVLRMSASEPAAPAQTGAAPAPEVKSVAIYVAAQAIPIGATITPEMVSSQPWPEHLMLDGFMKVTGGASPVGMVARAPFQTQEPIIASKVSNANDPNFLAGALPKGMRVVTIETNEINGLAGFIFPGDRVDILMTHDVRKWETPPTGENKPVESMDSVTETLLTNVTVLAVDQRSTSAGATDKEGKLVVPHSVSLMVSPPDAQRLLLGARKGTLALSLRALADRESADPLIITGIKDISQYQEQAGALNAGAGPNGVTIVRGTKTEQQEEEQRAAAAATAGQPASPVNVTTTVAPTPPARLH